MQLRLKTFASFITQLTLNFTATEILAHGASNRIFQAAKQIRQAQAYFQVAMINRTNLPG